MYTDTEEDRHVQLTCILRHIVIPLMVYTAATGIDIILLNFPDNASCQEKLSRSRCSFFFAYVETVGRTVPLFFYVVSPKISQFIRLEMAIRQIFNRFHLLPL